MAENIVDEDDEGFGDFKFVSYSYQTFNSNSNQNNNINRVDEDDDWGDFMDNFSQKRDLDSLRFQPYNGSFHPQNPCNPSEISQDLDLFGVFSENSMKSPESELTRVESGKNSAFPAVEKQWEKPRGALPLSIFGDEEQESDSVNPSLDDAPEMFSSKPAAIVNNGLNYGSGISINDLVGNLYSRAEQIKTETESSSVLVDGNDDFEDDGWEFKDAFSEAGGGNRDSAVKKDYESELLEVQVEATTIDPEIQVDGKKWETVEGAANTNGFSNSRQDFGDLFVTSDGFSQKPATFNYNFNFESDATNVNSCISDSYTEAAKQIGTETELRSDETFWDYKNAFSEGRDVNSSPKQKAVTLLDADIKVVTFEGEIQGNGKGSDYHQGPLPPMMFSNGKLDSDDSLTGQDIFSNKPTTYMKNGINSQGFDSKVSLNDLISNLYSQAEQIPTVDSSEKNSENRLNLTQMSSSSVNGEDSDGSSWEFKDAFLETRAEDQSSVFGLEGAHQRFPTESKLKIFLDFYRRLKEETCFIALRHLDDLKKAQKVAAISGEDAKAVALHEEIQAAYKILYQENVASEEVYSTEHQSKNIYVNKLLNDMQEPGFRALDSEYDLSKRISLAEKDLSSAIGLFEHAISMGKILTMGSMEEQSSYVTAWSKMISVCAQELKHGTLIWKKSLQKNVLGQVLSEPRGQQYILALGEIYRVVEVLRASAKLYKPWILSSLADTADIFARLEECSAMWSDLGLEEALRSISDSVGFGYEGTTKALLDSIKSVHDLDVLALQNHVFAQQTATCRLSVLSLGMLPDMKVVVWNGERFFLTLANLWANRVSCDPPKLPHIHMDQ